MCSSLYAAYTLSLDSGRRDACAGGSLSGGTNPFVSHGFLSSLEESGSVGADVGCAFPASPRESAPSHCSRSVSSTGVTDRAVSKHATQGCRDTLW